MAIVGYDDLRFDLESSFFEKLQPAMDEAQKATSLAQEIHEHEQRFYGLLSHAVRMDTTAQWRELLDSVTGQLGVDLTPTVFLFQAPVANCMCGSRKTDRHARGSEMVLLVSQHYFNDLNNTERASVLGHEIAHYMLGHVEVPRQAIAEVEEDTTAALEMKRHLLGWSMCCEISCDAVGFVASGCDFESCATALIKYTTGLDHRTLTAMDSQTLVREILRQHDDLSTSVFEGDLSTHPFTPLRLKVMSILPDLELIRAFGEEVTSQRLQSMRAAYARAIVHEIADVYPELLPHTSEADREVLFDLAIATAASDGTIDDQEIKAIALALDDAPGVEGRVREARQIVQQQGTAAGVEFFIGRAKTRAAENEMTRSEVNIILRHVFSVAAADGRIDSDELKTIYAFAGEYGFSKHDILYLAKQVSLQQR